MATATKSRFQRFPAKMKCDLCAFEGSAQQVGSHVRVTHADNIQKKVFSAIEKAGITGTSRSEVMKKTGWNHNRVGRILNKLKAAGLVVETLDHKLYTSESAPAKKKGRPKGSKNKKRSTNGKAVTATAKDLREASDIMEFIRSNNARVVKRAVVNAQEKLIEAHKAEYVRYFIQSLTELQWANMPEDKLERLAEVLVS